MPPIQPEETFVPDVSPLPERARLFHIGIPKSGTTSVQVAAGSGRATLRQHGVLYPGTGVNHRLAVLGFMERRWGWTADGIPQRTHWDNLMAEIEAETTRRIWFGHEFAAESDDKMAAKFVDAIGERLHVVVTLRSPGAILPSAWQQYVKAGVPVHFDDWLEAVLADPPNRKVTRNFHTRNDQAGVVRRWSKAAGSDNVTVVVLDKTRPELLFGAFEQMLALPQGTLVAQEMGGFASNRGLTVEEAELFRAFDEAIKPFDVHWKDFEALMRHGGFRRVMENRKAVEEKPRLPSWAVKRASELGAGYAEAIASTGVRVIGNLDILAEEVESRAVDDSPAPTVIPVELAVEAMVGMLSAATAKGAFFGAVDPKDVARERTLRLDRVRRESARFTLWEAVRIGAWFVVDKIKRALGGGKQDH